MMRHVEVRSRPNDRWRRFHEDRCMTLSAEAIVNRHDTIFTMGSCFAREIRFALDRQKLPVGPDYNSISIHPQKVAVDELPDRPHLNYFNSFTVRQEFDRLAGNWTQSFDDYWVVKSNKFGTQKAYQDPYKRLTFGRSPEELHDVLCQINSEIARAARAASVFLFTFGMTEVFRIKANGLIAGQKPTYFGGGGADETELYESGYLENLENLEAIRTVVKSLNPNARMIVTVSPVPLERTFTNRDIVVANTEGKAILRAVLGEFTRRHDDVTYFPAFEMVTSLGEKAYMPGDLRHVNPSVVDLIMQSFALAHVVDGPVDAI